MTLEIKQIACTAIDSGPGPGGTIFQVGLFALCEDGSLWQWYKPGNCWIAIPLPEAAPRPPVA